MGERWLVELHWGVALSSALGLIQVVDWMHYPKLYWVTLGGLSEGGNKRETKIRKTFLYLEMASWW